MNTSTQIKEEFKKIEDILLLDSRSSSTNKRRCAFAATLLFNCPISGTESNVSAFSLNNFIIPFNESKPMYFKETRAPLPRNTIYIEIMTNFISLKEEASEDLFRISVKKDFDKKTFHSYLKGYLNDLTKVKTSFFDAVRQHYREEFFLRDESLFLVLSSSDYLEKKVTPAFIAVDECTRQNRTSMVAYIPFVKLVKEKKELSKKPFVISSPCPYCNKPIVKRIHTRYLYLQGLEFVETGCEFCRVKKRQEEKNTHKINRIKMEKKVYETDTNALSIEIEKLKSILNRDARTQDLALVKKALAITMMMRMKSDEVMDGGMLDFKIMDFSIPLGKMDYPFILSLNQEVPMEEIELISLEFLSKFVKPGDLYLFRVGTEDSISDDDIFLEIKKYFMALILHHTNFFKMAKSYALKRYDMELNESNLFYNYHGRNRMSLIVQETKKIEFVKPPQIKQGKDIIRKIKKIASTPIDEVFSCQECNADVVISGGSAVSRVDSFKRKNFMCTPCKRKKASSPGYCDTCGIYLPEGKSCKDCRKKKSEKKAFYKTLDLANKEIYLSKIRVFGQGRTERVIFGKGRNSKNIHVDDIEGKSSNPESIFEEAARKEIRMLLSSDEGKELGLKKSMLEEILMLVMQERMINKEASLEECILRSIFQ